MSQAGAPICARWWPGPPDAGGSGAIAAGAAASSSSPAASAAAPSTPSAGAASPPSGGASSGGGASPSGGGGGGGGEASEALLMKVRPWRPAFWCLISRASWQSVQGWQKVWQQKSSIASHRASRPVSSSRTGYVGVMLYLTDSCCRAKHPARPRTCQECRRAGAPRGVGNESGRLVGAPMQGKKLMQSR